MPLSWTIADQRRSILTRTPPPQSYLDRGDDLDVWPPLDDRLKRTATARIEPARVLQAYLLIVDSNGHVIDDPNYPFYAYLVGRRDYHSNAQPVSTEYLGRGVFSLRVFVMVKRPTLTVALGLPNFCSTFGAEEAPEGWSRTGEDVNAQLRTTLAAYGGESNGVVKLHFALESAVPRAKNLPGYARWPKCNLSIAQWGFVDIKSGRYHPLGCRWDDGWPAKADYVDVFDAFQKVLSSRGTPGRVIMAGDSTTRVLAQVRLGGTGGRKRKKGKRGGSNVLVLDSGPHPDHKPTKVTKQWQVVKRKDLNSLPAEPKRLFVMAAVDTFGQIDNFLADPAHPRFPPDGVPSVDELLVPPGPFRPDADVLLYKPCPLLVAALESTDDAMIEVIERNLAMVRDARAQHNATIVVMACEGFHGIRNRTPPRIVDELRLNQQTAEAVTFWMRHFATKYAIPFFDASLLSMTGLPIDIVHFKYVTALVEASDLTLTMIAPFFIPAASTRIFRSSRASSCAPSSPSCSSTGGGAARGWPPRDGGEAEQGWGLPVWAGSLAAVAIKSGRLGPKRTFCCPFRRMDCVAVTLWGRG